MPPINRHDMEWEGSEVPLRQQRFSKVHVQLLAAQGESDTVSTHLVDQILSEEDYLLAAVLYSCGVGAHVNVCQLFGDGFHY